MLLQFIATTLIVGAALVLAVVCWMALQNKLDCNVYPPEFGDEPEDWT